MYSQQRKPYWKDQISYKKSYVLVPGTDNFWVPISKKKALELGHSIDWNFRPFVDTDSSELTLEVMSLREIESEEE